MKEVKSVTGWIVVFIMICFCLFCGWDYVHTKMENHEKRIAALEAEARPLFVVDKFSDVYLNGEKVYDLPASIGQAQGPAPTGRDKE